MQRPLLVLLIVLAAIVALVFAVLNLGGSEKPAQVVAPTKEVASGTGGPALPTDLTPGTGNRKVEPVKPTTRGPSGGPGQAMQFDNRLTGLVRNTVGQPVAGAEVTLSTMWTETLFFQNDVHDRTNEPRARTDAEGRYSFPGVEPRDAYSLVVTHPQYAMKIERTTPIPETGTLDQPPITLSPGAALSGYVKDEAGNLVPDATLLLEGEQYSGMPDAAPDRIETKTENTGYYSFTNVAPGRRTLTASAPGYGAIKVIGLVFEKEERQERDITLKVAQMICGRVLGPGSEGVPEALVLAVGVSGTSQTARAQVKTNAQGEFCFENLTPGEYNVVSSAKGWRMRPSRNTRVPTNTSNLVIEMQKEATVCGTVIDGATGQPVTSFSVRMRFWQGEGTPTTKASEEVTPVENAAGEFCIDGVGPTDYVVEAQAPGYAPSFSSNFTVTQSQDMKGIIVKLGRGGTITGRVVDGDGKPVARARVMTHENDWTDDELTRAFGWDYPTNATVVDVRTDDAGKFTCTGLTPEVYQVVVTANGFTQLTRKDLRVGESGSADAGDLKLARGGTVKGTFYDAAGKPLVGGTVNLRVTDGDTPANYTTRTTEGGKYYFANVMPGRYQLSGMRSNGVSANPFEDLGDANASQVKIIVAEGDTNTQDLRLTQ